MGSREGEWRARMGDKEQGAGRGGRTGEGRGDEGKDRGRGEGGGTGRGTGARRGDREEGGGKGGKEGGRGAGAVHYSLLKLNDIKHVASSFAIFVGWECLSRHWAGFP